MKSREHGTIATYNGTYAFITPDSGERDVFCHESELPDSPVRRGDRVSYDLAVDPYKVSKMLARNVRFENVQEAAEEERAQAESDYSRDNEEKPLAAALRRAGLKENPDAGALGG
jgi:cold shock CspA family protein